MNLNHCIYQFFFWPKYNEVLSGNTETKHHHCETWCPFSCWSFQKDAYFFLFMRNICFFKKGRNFRPSEISKCQRQRTLLYLVLYLTKFIFLYIIYTFSTKEYKYLVRNLEKTPCALLSLKGLRVESQYLVPRTLRITMCSSKSSYINLICVLYRGNTHNRSIRYMCKCNYNVLVQIDYFLIDLFLPVK